PYDEVQWETRTANIGNESGKTVFEQKDVEVPTFWSQLATNVVVSKYFRGHVGTPEREHSVRQLIDRVVNTIAAWAETQRYFATARRSNARRSGRGIGSGPVSFMKGYDAFAGVIKSGGKTRRAAKMVILDADHPDVVDFIDSKLNEEKKAWALIEQGYDPSFTGEAYGSVYFQNANHSVRVTEEFMNAVVGDKEWTTHAVVPPHAPMATYRAKDLFRKMAEAAHVCGDPGIQYDSTVNDWHTSANTDRIYA